MTIFALRSTELKSRRNHIKQKQKYGKYLGWGKKNYCIGDYMEIIFSPSKHSLCLQKDRLPDKIWIVSNTFRWNEECDLLRMMNKSSLKFSTKYLKNTFRSSIAEHLINYQECGKNFSADLFIVLITILHFLKKFLKIVFFFTFIIFWFYMANSWRM